METPLLQTKLYIPPLRPELVPRPRLIERLNQGLDRKLTLISAPAGFGKTTLVAEWGTGIAESFPNSGDVSDTVQRTEWVGDMLKSDYAVVVVDRPQTGASFGKWPVLMTQWMTWTRSSTGWLTSCGAMAT